MISTSLQNLLQALIKENTGISISSCKLSSVGGGSINQTFQALINEKERFFCKINSAISFPGMFEKEKGGLELLASKKILRVPEVVGTAIEKDEQILVLEWIEEGIRTDRFWETFGEQLARLHSIPYSFAGLNVDNYMGALPQFNDPSPDWLNFFIHQRLEPQIKLAIDKRLLQTEHRKQFEKLYNQLHQIFPVNTLCLLHGDLWSGNFLCDNSGLPVLIDPAVYHGHPAMDLAMTTLFGGFESIFYDSYNHVLPFAENYSEQWKICNLYPLLIHLNLFGKGYLQRIISSIHDY